MKYLIIIFSLLISVSLLADPIKDNVVTTKRTAWFANHDASGRLLTCRQTCKMNHSLIAEHELYDVSISGSSVTNRKYTHLCKVRTKKIENPSNVITHRPKPITLWVYGNEIGRERVCEYVGKRKLVEYAKRYLCLCATN